MSRTFNLVCHETRQSLWIGQGPDRLTILYGNQTERLIRFLNATKGHPLFVLCDATDEGDWDEYDEFEPEMNDESKVTLQPATPQGWHEFLLKWLHEGRLQTYEDRTRFRRECALLLDAGSGEKADASRTESGDFVAPGISEETVKHLFGVPSNECGANFTSLPNFNWPIRARPAYEDTLDILNEDEQPEASERKRVVVCAAVKFANGSVICSARHYDERMRETLRRLGVGQRSEVEQGFVDQWGIFMSRREAWGVATAAGQIVRRVGGDTTDDGTLYSENLY